jgi:phosphatidylserine decarboxylase
MSDIQYVNRVTGALEKERVYGAFFIKLLYGPSFLSRLLYTTILPLISRFPLASRLYGAMQKSKRSQKKIEPFIRTFQVDPSEFLHPVSSYASFNDFFIRKLNKEARPIHAQDDVAILPADARYLVYPNLSLSDGFLIKGATFSLEELLQDKELAKKYAGGAMLIARLCPSDYHRYHLPCGAKRAETRTVPGALFSVNPMAIKRNILIFTENKRTITTLETAHFGTVLYIAVGATYVGTIHETYKQEGPYEKGEELGYFSFGGSSLVLLFEPGTINFDTDLVRNSEKKIETRGLLGQSLGKATKLSRSDSR